MRKPDILSKWLHLGMASCICLCVFMSLAMNAHTKEVSWGLIWYNLHKFIGINFIVISSIYLIWSAKKQGKPLAELFPWINPLARAAIKSEFRQRRILRLNRITAVAQELFILVSVVSVAVLARVIYVFFTGAALQKDIWLTHLPGLASLFFASYLIAQVPWFDASARAGWGRELRRLKRVETHAIASGVQGLGIIAGLITTVLGLAIIIIGIFGVKFTADMALPKAHHYSTYVLIAYLCVHVGAALIHGMIGHWDIFKIGKVLERTTRVYIDPAMVEAWAKRKEAARAANDNQCNQWGGRMR